MKHMFFTKFSYYTLILNVSKAVWGLNLPSFDKRYVNSSSKLHDRTEFGCPTSKPRQELFFHGVSVQLGTGHAAGTWGDIGTELDPDMNNK